MAIKFRQFNFKDGNPYSGGVCILEDRSVVWAAMSDEPDGKGGQVAKLLLFPLEVEDRRPAEPTIAEPSYTRPTHRAKRRM
jgi:hypothetical protein